MSCMVRRIVLALLTLLLTGRAAVGQTTQPAPAAPAPSTTPVPALQAPDDVAPAAEWPVVVRKFAETLVSPAGSMVNSTALRPVIMKDCTVRRFDGGGMMLSDLTDRTAGALLVSARGYVAPVSTMAGDIAEDAAACKLLPEDIKGALMPGDVDG